MCPAFSAKGLLQLSRNAENRFIIGVPLEGVTNEEGQLTFTQLKGDSYWLVPMEKPNQRVKFGVTRLNQQQMLFIKRHKRIRTLDNEANRYQIKE